MNIAPLKKEVESAVSSATPTLNTHNPIGSICGDAHIGKQCKSATGAPAASPPLTLSDEINFYPRSQDYVEHQAINVEDVKEAVKQLKRWVEIQEARIREELYAEDIKLSNPFLEKIDEIFGSKLV